MPARKPAAVPDHPPPRLGSAWTFLTNHGHVLVCIAHNSNVRITEIADMVGIGERAAHRIVCDLANDGYVLRKKDGRRNTYAVNYDRPLRHPLESAHSIGEIFGALAGRPRGGR
jgi:Holliday junction resolvasome RuvABC DNA-binding subunit